ncbi:hypothetical protein [Halopiger xanaduensis]|uniref:Uncharacterized protein n=1 Tax=Halopiger xanaduensis (strain DSM 18323 / JCM 14033 / SH-6) TaxID=797210 RepID=F8DEV4_HALXS|nr:hypothetical protein [Halopiger xanaduensis]AEH39544.1 hypothetical protein Halxa_0305 [Halopiger xanaduensis SH-6]
MTDKSNSRATHSRWSRLTSAIPTRQLLAIGLAVLMVTSIMAGPAAAALGSSSSTAGQTDAQPTLTDTQLSLQTAEENVSYDDDFEDGDYTGWVSDEDGPRIDTDSFYGNYSINLTTDDFSGSGYRTLSWEDGPTFDTHDNFEISGTVKVNDGTNGDYRFGIENPEVEDEHGAVLVYDGEHDFFYLDDRSGSTPDDASQAGYETTDHGAGKWVNWRLQFDGGVASAKVWDAGTSQPDDWQIQNEFPQFEGKFMMTPGSGSENREMWLDQIDAGGNAISGQVVDQSGEPVSNATVGGMGVNYESINDSIDDKQAEAEELLSEAQDIEVPDEWQSFKDTYGTDGMLDSESFTSNVSGVYPLVHQSNDWGEGSTDYLQEEVDDPRISLESDREVVISLWDLTEQNAVVPEGPVDGSQPGKVTEGTVVLEQYGPGQGVVDTETIETQHEYTVSRPGPLPDGEFHAIKRDLSPGIYRVYPEGSPEKGYPFEVGGAEDQWSALETELRNEAGELTDRAKQLQQNVETGLFERRTTTTNETGHFTLRMQHGVQKATIQAYRADGTLLTSMTGPSFSDLRDLADGDYNGTFHVGPPVTHDVPQEDVTLETFRSDELPYQGINSLNQFRDWIQNQQLNETIDDLQSEYDQRFDEMERSALERVYDQHRTLVETVPGAEDRYLERSDYDSIQDADDLSNDELPTETNHMQVALAGIGEVETPELGENPIEIGDGGLNAEYPIPSGIDQDTLQPEIHWTNGSSTVIDDQYWSIDSGGMTGQDTLVIEDYPIDSDDPAAFDLRIMGAGEDGLLDDRLSATNPSFSGTIPDVSAIDVTTMSPGPSERVSMTFRPSDESNFGGVESVEVIGPDGQQVATDVSSDEASFKTDGEGKHFVRATVTDSTGGQFVHSFSLRALDQGRSDPPTIRAETATGDQIFAVVGEGLEDGRIQRTDANSLDVDAVVPGGEIPGSVHVKPQAAMDSPETNLDVRVLEGADEATVSSNIETVIHLDSLSTDARVWRGEPSWIGQPLGWDGGTRYGEVMERGGEDSDKVVIRTYTTGDGSAQITIDARDGFAGMWDSARHGVASTIPRPSLPFGLGMAAPAGGVTVGGVLGTVVIARRRRGAA